jgi:hypothetical protein
LPARRCSIDGINFPSDYRLAKCPVCGEDTTFYTNLEPDEDWADKVARLRERLETAAAGPPDIPCVETAVLLRAGQLWLNAWDVYAALRRRLKESDHIQVGKQTFEVLAYVHDTREYLVRSFSLTLSEDELARLASGR